MELNRPDSRREEKHQQVLSLRRSHSLAKVAELTGLPLGTVKTWCSRSGVFRDNLFHRAMFTLPPIQTSTTTEITVPELPEQRTVTGDKEIDSVLWLHQVIRTGQADLVEKAMVAAQRIKTPLAELEKRYTAYLARANPGNFGALFASFGFADLDRMAHGAVKKQTRQREARARFGDDIFVDTPAEIFCRESLVGIGQGKHSWDFDAKQVDSAFAKAAQLLPYTLCDCVHELKYWDELYSLRCAFENSGDPYYEVQAREDMLYRMMTSIRPRTSQEAVSVFRFMADGERFGRTGAEDILLNLIRSN